MGSFKGIADVSVVRVSADVSVGVLAPPRWSASGRRENTVTIYGFVSSRAYGSACSRGGGSSVKSSGSVAGGRALLR